MRAKGPSTITGPRTEAHWDAYTRALDVRLTPEDEAFINAQKVIALVNPDIVDVKPANAYDRSYLQKLLDNDRPGPAAAAPSARIPASSSAATAAASSRSRTRTMWVATSFSTSTARSGIRPTSASAFP